MVPQSLKVIVISVMTESSVGMTVSNCLQGKTHKHTITHTSERVQDGEQWPHMTLWSNTDSWGRVCKYTCDGLWDNEGSCHINIADVSFCKCILSEAQGWSLVAVQCFYQGHWWQVKGEISLAVHSCVTSSTRFKTVFL